jgi:hypothetical protein
MHVGRMFKKFGDFWKCHCGRFGGSMEKDTSFLYPKANINLTYSSRILVYLQVSTSRPLSSRPNGGSGLGLYPSKLLSPAWLLRGTERRLLGDICGH